MLTVLKAFEHLIKEFANMVPIITALSLLQWLFVNVMPVLQKMKAILFLPPL